MIIAALAFTAFTVFVSKRTGPIRNLERLQEANGSLRLLQGAVFARYFSQSTTPRVMPCPDTDQDGDEDCTDTTGTASGTIPWSTLGLSRTDVIDTYGRYYTYVALADAEEREVCENQQNDYATSQIEFTGALKDQTSLEVRLTSQAAGEGRYVPFAIISHGENGFGGISSTGAVMTAAASGSYEETNALDAGPSVVYTGPANSTEGSIFDDNVFAPTAADVQRVCESLSPGEGKNVALQEDFNDTTSTTIDTTKFDASATNPPTQSNGVANFTTSSSYLATESTYDFTANVEPVYVSALWTPGATNAGFSIATRATLTPTGDDFTTGLTFRFDDRDGSTSSASPGTSNTISIRANSAAITTTGSDPTINIITGQQYLLEVYDNGSTVWMRITQVSAPTTNAATIQGTNTTDLTGDQRVVLINGAGASTIDDLSIGVPMLSLQTGPTGGYAASASGVNGTTTGSITLEAWIKPRSLPSGSAEATIISQWDTDTSTTEDTSSFRLHLVGSTFAIDLQDAAGSGDAETLNLGFGPTVNEWMHIAVSFDRTTRAVRAYKDGVLSYSGTSTLDSNGIRAAAYSLAVGADSVNSPPVNFFYGNISDVRVWQDVRTATEVARCYQKRLPSTAPCTTTDLVANWKLDPTTAEAGLSETDVIAAVGQPGTVTSPASYGPALAAYFRPMSSDTGFCPVGTRVGAYQCDFRTVAQSTTITVPSNLPAIYVKVWGGGGGAYDVGTDESVGGSGGYSAGLVESIGGTAMGGTSIGIVVGGLGTGSTSSTNGAGGGGASGVRRTTGLVNGLVAGGGGGASYASSTAGGGGLGGGYGVNAGNGTDATNLCAGRGGNAGAFGASPPSALCLTGGLDPGTSNGNGASGGGTNAGGASAIGSGGNGYDALVTYIGGGGGGGGYRSSVVSGGGGEAGGYRLVVGGAGYGGGGGSAYADSGVANPVGESGSIQSVIPYTVYNYTGDFDSSNGPGDQPDRIENVNSLLANGTTGSLADNGGCDCIPDMATGTVGAGGSRITMNVNATATSIGHAFTFTVAGTAVPTPAPGGSNDNDYGPSYATSTNATPGRGGYAGTVNGVQGAVILRW
jgi:hypothetical protein